jgi:L-arabinose isomerase
VQAMASAGALRGRSVLRVGDPVPGYADITASQPELAQLGLHERSVTRGELDAAVASAASPTADRDAQLATALQRLADETQAICGTVNCHSDLFRFNPRIGIAACYGVACLTQRGQPFSCTGDQPTAIALYLMRAVAGASLYCESYAPDPATNTLLLLAGGEADPAWCAPGGKVEIVPNVHFPGMNGPGASLSFVPRLGPATLMSLSPAADGWVLAWATGELVESRFTHLRGPNAMFRFDGVADVLEATNRWITSGATHHYALGPGRLDLEMTAIAAALRIRSVHV